MPHAGHCHVAEGIIVLRIFGLRPPSPLVPIPPVSGIQRHPGIVQEVPLPSAAEIRQGRFRGDRIAFNQGQVEVQAGGKAFGKVAQDVVGPAPPGLPLGHVSAFMDGQQFFPRQEVRIVGFAHGVKGHAPGNPYHHSVRRGRPGVEHDGHLVRKLLVRDVSGGPGNWDPPLLQRLCIYPGKGIKAVWIDYLIISGTN